MRKTLAATAAFATLLATAAIAQTGGRPLTASLSIDYLGPARPGQWLIFETGFVKTGRTLCVASALVLADGVPCARANATFTLAAPPLPEAAPEAASRTTKAPAFPPGPSLLSCLKQVDQSITATMCGSLAIAPRTSGVSSTSTTLCILPRPRPIRIFF